MAQKKSALVSFASGFVRSREIAYVIASIDSLRLAGSTATLIMKWMGPGGTWSHFEQVWTAVRLWVKEKPDVEFFVLGADGTVGYSSTYIDNAEEQVDPTEEGPSRRGPLRDLRWIGNHLYVAGMGRQVYRREGPGRWVRKDQGVVLDRGVIEVAGFNAISGLDEDDIYAVGYGGDIWRRVTSEWRQMESPTNVMLNRVRAIDRGLVYACGQKGVLLRGHGELWETIDHGATTDSLWGMEWFNGRLYASSDAAVYVLEEDDHLKRVDMGGIKSCGHLHANHGVMWSFGTKHLAWTDDGVHWHEVTPG